MGQYQRELEDQVAQLEKMVKEALTVYRPGLECDCQGWASIEELQSDYMSYREEYPEEAK